MYDFNLNISRLQSVITIEKSNSMSDLWRDTTSRQVVRYNEQSKSELDALERMQPSAYEQMKKVSSFFAITTM